MLDPLIIALALLPWVPVLAIWIRRYRSGKLRIRFMAITAAVGGFVTLAVPVAVLAFRQRIERPLGEVLLTLVISSVIFGATFLLWWPLFRKSLSKKGILW